MRVFVTGAAGYVGRNLVEGLLRAGHNVTAHARRPVPGGLWERAPDKTAAFDLALEPAIEKRLGGLEAVVHCAARLRGGDASALTRDNVTASSRLAEAARRAGVGRFVHMSSVAVYGSSPPRGASENAPIAPDTAYGASKAESERAVTAAFGSPVILRPGLVWGGPHDARFLRPLTAALNSGLFAFPGPCDTPFPFTHVQNLADAVALALQSNAGGALNVTDGLEISIRRFVEVLAVSLGHRVPRFTLPLGPAAAAVSFADGLRRRLAPGAALPVTPSALRMMNTPCVYSIERARAVLGYAPVPREHLACAS